MELNAEQIVKALRAEADCERFFDENGDCGICPMPKNPDLSYQSMCVDFAEKMLPLAADLIESQVAEIKSLTEQLSESQRREGALAKRILYALELIQQEEKGNSGRTENIRFHGGVIYALAYARAVLPDLEELEKMGYDPQEAEKGEAE